MGGGEAGKTEAMLSIKQALSAARKDVSPVCEFGHRQWVVYWTSRRGREQSLPTSYAQARAIRAARVAGIAAERLAEARGMDDPCAVASYAEEFARDGERAEDAVRRSMNYGA
jgi:hypothetical protein